MTCRHTTGDPACGSTTKEQKVAFYADKLRACDEGSERYRPEYARAVDSLVSSYGGKIAPDSPDPDDYEIIQIEQVGDHLVVKVQYSSCKDCAFGACKVLVHLDVPILAAIHWRHVDPHFTDTKPADKTHAPPPRARFPADASGWVDAIAYARSKEKRVKIGYPVKA